MNQIFLIPFLFFVLLTTVNAEELYNCTDSNGKKVITSSPQDGMKCAAGESNDEPSSPKKASKSKGISSENVVDTCENLYRESEKISDEIQSFNPLLSELQREQFDIRQKSVNENWNYKTESKAAKHIRDEQYKINQQISLLNQKQSLISNDIRMHKCDQIKQDLSRLNHGNVTINNPTSQKNRKSTFIMRNGSRSVIIRD